MQHGMIHGTAALLLAYLMVLIPLFIGLWRNGGNAVQLMLTVVIAWPVLLATAVMAVITGPLVYALGVTPNGVLDFIITCIVCASIGYGTGCWLGRRRRSEADDHRRGAIVRLWGWRKGSGRDDKGDSLTLCGVPLTLADETKHFKFIGTTGTGKSTAIRELLSGALKRGDRAIVADPDGGYLNHFYDRDRGDVILNPFDPDSV